MGVAALILFKVGQRFPHLSSHPNPNRPPGIRNEDYSVRAEPRGHDELTLLTQTFNEMLTKIQEDGQALRTARDELNSGFRNGRFN